MLLKNLKTLIEVDENVDTKQPENNNVPVKTDKQRKLDKETTDGIANEEQNTAIKVAEFLEPILSQSYGAKDIKAEKSMVIIKGVKDKATNSDFINSVQQATIAAIGMDGNKKFDITGPFPFGDGVAMTFTKKG